MKNLKYHEIKRSLAGLVTSELRQVLAEEIVDAEQRHKKGKCDCKIVSVTHGHSLDTITCIMCGKWRYFDSGAIDERDVYKLKERTSWKNRKK